MRATTESNAFTYLLLLLVMFGRFPYIVSYGDSSVHVVGYAMGYGYIMVKVACAAFRRVPEPNTCSIRM